MDTIIGANCQNIIHKSWKTFIVDWLKHVIATLKHVTVDKKSKSFWINEALLDHQEQLEKLVVRGKIFADEKLIAFRRLLSERGVQSGHGWLRYPYDDL